MIQWSNIPLSLSLSRYKINHMAIYIYIYREIFADADLLFGPVCKYNINRNKNKERKGWRRRRRRRSEQYHVDALQLKIKVQKEEKRRKKFVRDDVISFVYLSRCCSIPVAFLLLLSLFFSFFLILLQYSLKNRLPDNLSYYYQLVVGRKKPTGN